MPPFTAYKHSFFSQNNLDLLQKTIGKSFFKFQFGELSFIFGDKKQLYGYDFIRFLITETDETNRPKFVHSYTFQIPHFIFSKHLEPQIGINIFKEKMHFKDWQRSAKNNLVMLEQAGVLKKVYIIHERVKEIDYEITSIKNLKESITNDLDLTKIPETFDYLISSFDILTFIVFEFNNNKKFIIERLDSPGVFEIFYDDSQKWNYIMTAINDDNGEPMFTIVNELS